MSERTAELVCAIGKLDGELRLLSEQAVSSLLLKILAESILQRRMKIDIEIVQLIEELEKNAR